MFSSVDYYKSTYRRERHFKFQHVLKPRLNEYVKYFANENIKVTKLL